MISEQWKKPLGRDVHDASGSQYNSDMAIFDLWPRPSTKRIAIHVEPTAERALRAGHPWVFDQSIRSQSHAGQSGDLAVIFGSRRHFLAIGLYDPDSPIRVRVLQHHQPATIDRAWYSERLRAAAAIRRPLLLTHTNGYRLVHGENDGLPGLIIDRYADTLAVKLYTAAWLPHLADIIAGLDGVQPFEHLVLRYSRNLEARMALNGLSDGQTVSGAALTGPVIFQENGLTFTADVVHGHKTGFFFDQRENRAHVRELSPGRRVLDVFAYSGGFSVYAAAGGATSVTSVDISAPALEAAESNFALNRADAHGRANPKVKAPEHNILVADAFECLKQLHSTGQTFDMVIVDPPAFAKSAGGIERALAAYARLTRLATDVLGVGGLLVIASCSNRVTANTFFDTVTRAAQNGGHPLTEIRRTGHALDHPIGFPEGEYLKCLFATAAP
jgi:23S rRNA (cytosine1962-C5)-methyltransferase